MTKARVGDQEFVELFRNLGPTEMANRLAISQTKVHARRRRLEQKLGITIEGPNKVRSEQRIPQPQGEHRARLEVRSGHVLVASDAHYWPGEETLLHRALVRFTKELRGSLRALILNGDVMDFPAISRHAAIGWESRPKVQDEIEWAQERLDELQAAAGRIPLIWTLGNHDARFESRLANLAPEYAKVHGVHLKDHFPLWRPCWSVWLNDDTVCKHRFRGGIHAVHNNLLWSGKNILTGHLHSARVVSLTDYNGTRWGVDTGCLAEPSARAFTDYTEDNPLNWRSAFAVLTFVEGRLLQPELVLKFDEKRVQFRGELITP